MVLLLDEFHALSLHEPLSLGFTIFCTTVFDILFKGCGDVIAAD